MYIVALHRASRAMSRKEAVNIHKPILNFLSWVMRLTYCIIRNC